jgi:ElaB/YqjD/DUF883 family membrane-anchored ribosome-binding protein
MVMTNGAGSKKRPSGSWTLPERELFPLKLHCWFECCFPSIFGNSTESMMKLRAKATKTGMEAIQDDIATIGEDVVSLGSTLGDVASVETRATIDSIRQRLDRIASDTGDVTRLGVGAMQDTIAERPFTSAAVALGLGFILGVLSRGSPDRHRRRGRA